MVDDTYERTTRKIGLVAWYGSAAQFGSILQTMEKALKELADREHSETIAQSKRSVDSAEAFASSDEGSRTPYAASEARGERLSYERDLANRQRASQLKLNASRPGASIEMTGSAENLAKTISGEPFDAYEITSRSPAPSTADVVISADKTNGLRISVASNDPRWSKGTIQEFQEKVQNGVPWFGKHLTRPRWALWPLLTVGTIVFVLAVLVNTHLLDVMATFGGLRVGVLATFTLFVIVPSFVIAAVLQRIVPIFAINLGDQAPLKSRLAFRWLFPGIALIAQVALALVPSVIVQ